MFTNAGMNQFKDIFLDNAPVKSKRIANTQKCLRVSGKHNDLEEVGHDGYHHTMFEMLGNWSFGDYFKKEAIAWAWEFLTGVLKIEAHRLYATVFKGSPEEGIEMDQEAFDFWRDYLPEDQILKGSRKDNFWEMGDTGPCGPCSEIHVDLRPERDRKVLPGRELVNKGNPNVMEIWNLVFIQFNRKAGGELVWLPSKHVDTGMGFERLCMVIQKKTSNYDTDIFQPVIQEISTLTGMPFGKAESTDTAMRVVADHLRAIVFSIADGQLPSNTKAGYVIRRILRRAVRYYYSFLDQQKPLIFKLVPSLVSVMGDAFPEIRAQQQLIEKVIYEEEQSFLRTLESGDKRLKESISLMKAEKNTMLSGKVAFELYDTYGFPLDLTELILKEEGFTVNRDEFNREMAEQRNRSRSASVVESDDWVILRPDQESVDFIGYDRLHAEVRINRFRKVKARDRQVYHLVFNQTPFYAESGGQVGDAGYIDDGEERIRILNTYKEHGLIIHEAEKLPANPSAIFDAEVSEKPRLLTENNHTATHLLHYALRKVLGKHVEQKGSLVNAEYLRFDFSHFQKLTDEELTRVEQVVNELIRENVDRTEIKDIPMNEAKKMGAMALFGEKYGDKVRVIKFGDSIELCGGTHVDSTSRIGLFKITSEGSIAAGIRRIEAITGERAEQYYRDLELKLKMAEQLLNRPQDLLKALASLIDERNSLQKQLERHTREFAGNIKASLLRRMICLGDFQLISAKVDGKLENAGLLRDIAFQLKGEVDNLFLVIGAEVGDKPHLAVLISEPLVKVKNLHAGHIVKAAAGEINGGGGGQAFFATAGGTDVAGLDRAIEKAAGFAYEAAGVKKTKN
jgi:alanyl-tRNA synthetase